MIMRILSPTIVILTLICSDVEASCVVHGLASVAGRPAAHLADRACHHALEVGRVGEAFRFQDLDIPVMGKVTAGEAYQDRAGLLCRRLTIETVSPEGKSARRRQWVGVACRVNVGRWVWSDVKVGHPDGEGSAVGEMREVQRRF